MLGLVVLADSARAQTAGPIAAYSFSEGAGTAIADVSGNSNAATVVGATQWDSGGRYGNALLLGGGTQGARAPASTTLNIGSELTVEAWICVTSVDAYPKVLWRDGGSGSPYYLGLAFGNGTVNFGVTTVAGTFSVNAYTAVVPNVWTHLAGTYDGATLRVYINGSVAAAAAASGAVVASDRDLWLGRAPWGEGLPGRLDEVRIYSRALSAAEIALDRDTQVNGWDPPDVGDRFPAPHAMGVSPAAAVRAVFSKAMDGDTITGATFYLTGPSGPVPAAVAYDAATQAATLTPSAPLARLSEYTVHITTAVGDLDEGSFRAPVTWTFITGPDPTLAHAAYSFSEGSGVTTMDASANGNTATLTRPTLWTAAGRYGNGLALGGAADGARVPAAPSLDVTTALTLEAWVYPASIANYPKLIWRDAVNGSPFNLGLAWGNGSVVFTIGTSLGTYSAFAYSAVVPAVWTHIAATYDGAALRVFINGQLSASAPAGGTIMSSTRDLWLGRAPWGEGCVGTLDDVRIYGRALSAGEIVADMGTAAEAVMPRPSVTSVTPAAAARNVPLTSAVRIVFGDPVDPATINADTVQLSDTRNVVVPSAISYDPSSLAVTLTPLASLQPTRPYTVTIRGGTTAPVVANIVGNTLAATYSWSFVTTVEPTRVAAGNTHSVAVDGSGQVWTWGSGAQQLGTVLDGRVPGSVAGASGVLSVAAGGSHTLALKTDGTVVVWGVNANGQLGINSLTAQPTPVSVGGLANVIAVAAGRQSSMALKADGTVWTWGYWHQLGGGQASDSKVPVQVPALADVIAIASGDFADYALGADGTVWAWGENTFGQIGDGTSGSGLLRLTPVQVASLTGVVGIGAGDNHAFAVIGADLSLRGWGSNNAGQLGTGSTSPSIRNTPVPVSGPVNVRHVDGGDSRTVVALLDGTVVTWGSGVTASSTDSSLLIAVPGAPAGVQVASGNGNNTGHGLSITAAGIVWSWGSNGSAQLGDGTRVSRAVALPISGDSLAWKVSTPEFSRATGTYTAAQTVTVTAVTAGATIRYTTNGNDPTDSDAVVASGGTIGINQSATLKAKAWKTGTPASNVMTAVYTLQVPPPTFSPAAGTYTSARTVTLAAIAGATIRYTVDGSTPTAASPVYTGPFTVGTTSTVRAYASFAGWSDSNVAAATYTMNFGTLTAPTFAPSPGTYEGQAAVTLAAQAGSTIRYTTDGSAVTATSTVYSQPVILTQSATVRAKAFRVDFTASAEASAAYTIVATAPVFSRASGTYAPGASVSITDADPSVTIRITLNGADPTSSDTSVPSGSTLLVGGFTLKARAFKTGTSNSTVVSATYTLSESFGPGALAAGGSHTLAATPDGLLYAWGEGASGQLGLGATGQKRSPTIVPTLTGVTSIAAGSSHTVASTWDGRLFAWGSNASLQIGDGAGAGSRLSPILLAGLPPIVAVAAGSQHSLALASDGHVYAWGTGVQLGLGATTSAAVPTLVSGLSDVVAIAAGSSHSVAITGGGQLYAWGQNASSQLGDGGTTSQSTPELIAALTDVVAIAAGGSHSLARAQDGRVFAWGANSSGQLGLGDTALRKTPTAVPSLIAAGMVAGGSHSIALRTDGVLTAWGANNVGQVGEGAAGGIRSSPVPVANVSQLALIAAGASHGVAVTLAGRLSTWGLNTSGQLGDGLTANRAAPFEVLSVPGVWGTTPVPILSVAPGTYTAPLTVVVSNVLGASAEMHYTTSGLEPTQSDPSIASGASLPVAQNVTLKLRTWVAGRPPSAVLTASYVLQADAPVVIPATGIYTSAQAVTIVTSTSDAVVRCTTDGTEPVETSPLYSGPLGVDTFTVLKARVFREGWSPSTTATATFTFNYGTLATPTVDPAGGTYRSGQVVSLSGDAGVQLRYTLTGTDPDAASTPYTAPFTLPDGFVTLKARAFRTDWTESDVLTANYTITDDTMPPSITASLLPAPNAAGWNSGDVVVTFACEDPSGVAVCTVPRSVEGEGEEMPVTGSSTDVWGNQVTRTWSVNIDRTAPALHVFSPAEGSTVRAGAGTVTIRGGAAELSGLDLVTCGGVPAPVTGNLFTCSVSVGGGPNAVAIVAVDRAGNTAERLLTFTVGEPSITDIDISPGTITMFVGDTREVAVTDQDGVELHDGLWTVSNPSIVQVDVVNGTTIVSALAEGEADLTVSSHDRLGYATVTVLAAGSTLPADTTLWRLNDTSGWGAPKRGAVLRAGGATDDPGADPARSPALFFVDEGVDWGLGMLLQRFYDRPTRIRTTAADGRQLSNVSFIGRAPQQIAADNHGGFIVVLPAKDGLPSTIQRFDSRTGEITWEYAAARGLLSDAAIHPSGVIYLAEARVTGVNELVAIMPSGVTFRTPLPHGSAVTIDLGTCGLGDFGMLAGYVTGPIIRADGAVVLLSSFRSSVRKVESYPDPYFPSGCAVQERSFEFTQHFGLLTTMPDDDAPLPPVAFAKVERGDEFLPSQFWADEHRLLPDGHGGVLLVSRKTPSVWRIADGQAVGWVSDLLPDNQTSTKYETEWVLGEDGGYALVNSSRRTNLPGGPTVYESTAVQFDTQTLAKISDARLGTPMSDPQHIRLKFALAGGGIYASGPAAAYVVNPTVDTAGFAAGGNATHIAAGVWTGWSGATPGAATGGEPVMPITDWVFPAGDSNNNAFPARPLTTWELARIATNEGIAGLDGIQRNRTIGLAFQGFALWSLFGTTTPNYAFMPSPERAAIAGVPHVVPDKVRAVLANLHFYRNSAFDEVKAVNGSLSLRSNRNQLVGYIDVAQRSELGQARIVMPAVTLITTQNTLIAPDVITEATLRGVEIRQRIAMRLPGDYLRIDGARSLNATFGQIVNGHAALPFYMLRGRSGRLVAHPGDSPDGDPDPPELVP